jgi:hypothetical protein
MIEHAASQFRTGSVAGSDPNFDLSEAVSDSQNFKKNATTGA